MSEDIAISVENLSKSYLIGHQARGQETFREMIGRHARQAAASLMNKRHGRNPALRNSVEEFWALRDVSFELRRGEVLGVIGRNGAGKSTLLKVLSRITQPTDGRVIIRGRVASLLEVGTGFHPELTGRENIFLNGAILGMNRKELSAKFDQIVDFAEVERFLDTPVKRYSSGMYVRLAFAVAANLEPEILIIDEVLAVGDMVFQKKCMGKMQDIAGSGRTVIFVSHNMQTVAGLTDRAILLEDGRLAASGPARQVIDDYLLRQIVQPQIYRLEAKTTQPAITYVSLKNSGPGAIQQHGAPLTIEIEITTPEPVRNAAISFVVHTSTHQPVLHILNLDCETAMLRAAGICRLTCTLPKLRLYPGHYYLNFYLGASDPRRNFGGPQQICPFEVSVLDEARDFYWYPNAAIYVDESQWTVDQL